MLSLHPLSARCLRTTSLGYTCLRTFTSSAPKPDVFSDLLGTLSKDDQRSRPSRPAPTRLATPDSRNPPSSVETSDARPSPVQSKNELSQTLVEDIARMRPTEQQVAEQQEGPSYERQMTRRWAQGDVYSPHDLSGVEMSKWKRVQAKNFQGRPTKDVFDTLKINPLNHYWNFAMMSEFMTDMGRIKHNKETGLRPVNQRKVARAVRRAIGIGLMPSVHQHPEILERRLRPQVPRR